MTKIQRKLTLNSKNCLHINHNLEMNKEEWYDFKNAEKPLQIQIHSGFRGLEIPVICDFAESRNLYKIEALVLHHALENTVRLHIIV